MALAHDATMANEVTVATSTFVDDSFLPTPVPEFDVEAFARDSELAPSDITERPTVPPPPLNPTKLAPLREAARPTRGGRTLGARLTESTTRFETLAQSLRVGALSREEAARIARSDLAAIARAAEASGDERLRGAMASLRGLVEELGGVADEASEPTKELLVVGRDPRATSVIATALELQGHSVRVTARLPRASPSIRDVPASAVFVAAAELAGATRPAEELFPNGSHLVVYGDGDVEHLARAVGACDAVRTDAPFDQVLADVAGLLQRMGS